MHDSDILPDFPLENRLLFDWVSFTSRTHSLIQLVELLGLTECKQNFETFKGSKGFMYRMYFGGISIHFNELHLNGSGDFIWLEMSGQGCRTFETYGNGNYDKLFKLVISDPDNIHLTRLDVAFDEFEGLFNIDTICEYTKEQYFVSRIHNWQSIYSNKGNSVQFGSRMSKVLIRIYDKASERGYDNTELHWIRCELQLKDNNALGFVKRLQDNELQDVYLGVLKNYLSFREPRDDSNKRRWPETEWWSTFLDNAVRMSVFSVPGVEYNLTACERYVFTQPIGSIQTLIQIYGKDGFFTMVERAPPPKNPKYRQLLIQAQEEEKLKSKAAVLDKWLELVSDDELEYLNELKEGFQEVHRLHELRRKEFGREKLEHKIRRDLALKTEKL